MPLITRAWQAAADAAYTRVIALDPNSKDALLVQSATAELCNEAPESCSQAIAETVGSPGFHARLMPRVQNRRIG